MEHNRARALAALAAHDYQLVIPPLAEYLETLTAGNLELDLQTFKLTDTLSGRTLGVRADQTPQIAARRAPGGIRRYCYCGPVLRARPPQPWLSREGMQLGAELFGAPAPAGDWEIIQVASAALRALGLTDLRLDLGHTGLFLLLTDGLPAETQKELMHIVARRDSSAIKSLGADGVLSAETARHLLVLATANGGADAPHHAEILAEVESALPKQARAALQELAHIARQCAADGMDTGVDLSDLGSYDYHTGVVFTFYDGRNVAARGGRYQQKNGDIGVGFSTDLRVVGLRPPPEAVQPEAVQPPPPVAVPLVGDDENWRAAVAALRAAGRRIRFVYEEDAAVQPPALRKTDGGWTLQET